MRIALYGKKIESDFIQYFNQLIDSLKQNNVLIFIYSELYNSLSDNSIFNEKKTIIYHQYNEIHQKIDLLISIGGDGTFLEAVTFIKKNNVPLLGLNSGRLGFLANISKDEISTAINELIEKKYTIENRSLLKVSLPNGEKIEDFNYALNEITIHKNDSSSMINIITYINDEYLNSYWADGLIVATPTGSTAYSLSAGGPIVVPNSNNFILTPLAPHNLNVRPMVIGDNNIIKLKVESRSNIYLASLDYRSKVFDKSIEIVVEKADYEVKLIKLSSFSFFKTLRNKLLWGEDKRNVFKLN